MSRFIFAPLFLILICELGYGMDFDKEITKLYPGYQILKTSEFDKNIIKDVKGNPSLVIGKFRTKSTSDFAALIRTNIKKTYKSAETSYDYYDGKFVVCHGQTKGSFQCKELSNMPVSIPYESYLAKAGHKKTKCIQSNDKIETFDVKTDAIGWYTPEKGGSDWIWQSGDKYLNCVTSD